MSTEPFYDRDGIKLFCGDNCETMLKMEPASVDLVVTSPPYDDLRTYGGHSWDFYGVAWNLKRLLKPGGVIVWNVAHSTVDGSETMSSFEQAQHFRSLGLNIHDTMIWKKPSFTPGDGKYRYHDCFEYVFIVSAGTPRTINLIRDVPATCAGSVDLKNHDRRNGKRRGGELKTQAFVRPEFGYRTNVWEISRDVAIDRNHEAPFPEELARDHILSWSNEGDVVLDPFCGSGTTMKMARETGRRGIGIEINQEYCDSQVKRLEQRILFGVES